MAFWYISHRGRIPHSESDRITPRKKVTEMTKPLMICMRTVVQYLWAIGLLFTLGACGTSTTSSASVPTATTAPTATATTTTIAPTATTAPTATATSATQTTPTTASGTMISIQNYDYSPNTLTISVGTTVTWKNLDNVPHTVADMNNPRSFGSKLLTNGTTYSYTFTQAGTFQYFCTMHPFMTGTIIVQ